MVYTRAVYDVVIPWASYITSAAAAAPPLGAANVDQGPGYHYHGSTFGGHLVERCRLIPSNLS